MQMERVPSNVVISEKKTHFFKYDVNEFSFYYFFLPLQSLS